ncbi:MAG: hypothetical protein NVS9B4_11200 [Candidatus Acidiferrum sp.]
MSAREISTPNNARNGALHFLARTGLAIVGLFLVTMLLAAMPGHRVPAQPAIPSQQSAPSRDSSPSQDHKGMAGMDMGGEKRDEKASEADAVASMTPGHVHGANGDHDQSTSLHMYMTSMGPQNPHDVARANEVVRQLRAGIEKYKDYRVALNDGYKIFLPNLPQPEYHFTNYRNGFLEAFLFDPARPTSLLYKKTSTGYELKGAMYTMPQRATEDQLNARVPLSVAMWHLHTNLCMPPKEQGHNADWSKFGLKGSIATQEACDAAGGRFHPIIFGWMVHVYPYEDSPEKIFAMHHHMD